MTEKSRKAESCRKSISKFYKQKFRQEWKTIPALKNWLCEDEGNIKRAYCRYCKCNLLSKYCDLLSHSKTNKHLRAASLYEENEESSEPKDAPNSLNSSNTSYPTIKSENNVSKVHETEEQINPLEATKMSSDNISIDGECLMDYNFHSDDEDKIVEELVTDMDTEIRSPFVSKIQAERIKAETEYFRQKALYFSKLVENSRVQRTLMILQSRKLHLEVQKLQKEI